MSDCRVPEPQGYDVARLRIEFKDGEVPWMYPLALNGRTIAGVYVDNERYESVTKMECKLQDANLYAGIRMAQRDRAYERMTELEKAIAATLGAQTAGVAEKIEELRRTSLAFPPNIRRKVNIALSGIEQAIAATLGRPKAKSHPYGYERDTGAYDCTRCECGCINDISATYCNDCGGEIEIDESAEKEYYDGYSKHTVFAKKHDDGSLEFCERRYIPEDAATQGSGTLTAEQVREAVMSADRLEKPMGNTGLTNTHLIIRDDGWQAIADELNATLGGGECEWVLEHSGTLYDKWRCSECGYLYVESRTDGGATELDPNFCPKCGRKAVKR